jgi:hypothetical protein
MKIKCYDKYRKQHLTIEWTDDELWNIDTFNSKYCVGNVRTTFSIDGEGEDPHPKRWSDLEQFEIIK